MSTPVFVQVDAAWANFRAEVYRLNSIFLFGFSALCLAAQPGTPLWELAGRFASSSESEAVGVIGRIGVYAAANAFGCFAASILLRYEAKDELEKPLISIPFRTLQSVTEAVAASGVLFSLIYLIYAVVVV